MQSTFIGYSSMVWKYDCIYSKTPITEYPFLVINRLYWTPCGFSERILLDLSPFYMIPWRFWLWTLFSGSSCINQLLQCEQLYVALCIAKQLLWIRLADFVIVVEKQRKREAKINCLSGRLNWIPNVFRSCLIGHDVSSKSLSWRED